MTSLAEISPKMLDAPRPAASGDLMGPGIGTKDIRKVAAEYASLFYSMMLDEMQKTVPANDFFGSRGEEVFRSMWIDEAGRAMASRKGDPLTAMILAKAAYRADGGTSADAAKDGGTIR